MGLAILPARLKDELKLLSDCLLNKVKIKDYPELSQLNRFYHQFYQLPESFYTPFNTVFTKLVKPSIPWSSILNTPASSKTLLFIKRWWRGVSRKFKV